MPYAIVVGVLNTSFRNRGRFQRAQVSGFTACSWPTEDGGS